MKPGFLTQILVLAIRTDFNTVYNHAVDLHFTMFCHNDNVFSVSHLQELFKQEKRNISTAILFKLSDLVEYNQVLPNPYIGQQD